MSFALHLMKTGKAIPISIDPGINNIAFASVMNGETGKPRRDANGKKMHRRITNDHYHHKIKTQRNMKKVSKRLGDLEIHDTALSMVPIRSSKSIDIENHIFQCSYATSVMNINGEWQEGNAIALKFVKMLQNWDKSMQL